MEQQALACANHKTDGICLFVPHWTAAQAKAMLLRYFLQRQKQQKYFPAVFPKSPTQEFTSPRSYPLSKQSRPYPPCRSHFSRSFPKSGPRPSPAGCGG